MFHLIDWDNWERKTHFEYYTQALPCGYSLTAKLDVTELLGRAGRRGLKFYPSILYCIAAAVNDTREFQMGLDAEGRPGYWDELHLVHTLFHKDDKTFSDIWSYFDRDFASFYANITGDMEEYKDRKGVKTKPGQPPNFFCVSCTPWLHYEGYSTYAAGGTPALFPVITFGQYREEGGRFSLPLTVTISHAAADGYHTSLFFRRLQEQLDADIF